MGNSQNQSDAVGNFSLTAPKDFFEKNFISNDGVEPIICKEIKEFENDKKYILNYYLNDTIQRGSFVSILHAFETDTICMATCTCWGYDRDDHPIFYGLQEIDEVRKRTDCWEFEAVFCDRETSLYRFSVVADINASGMTYHIKIADFNKKRCK